MESQTAGKPGTESGRKARLGSQIRIARWVIQVWFLVFFVVLVTGTVCTAILAGGIAVSEPLGFLQLLFAGLSFNRASAVMTSTLIFGTVIFIVAIILLGKAFCAWACPVGTLIDIVDKALEKLKFRPYFARNSAHEQQNGGTNVFRNSANRYAVLASGLVASALFRFPAWCVVCPIGTICRGVVAGAEIAVGAELLAVPAVGALSLGEKRFWCRYLCPVGGFLTLLSRLNPFIKPKIKQDASRKDCGACRTICPEGIDICHERSFASCTKCLDCYAKCPFGSVRIALM